MSFTPDSALDPSDFLAGDAVIEIDHPRVRALGERLRGESAGDADFARRAFEWVRDEVAHSYDAQDPRVTLRASDVLEQRVGLCYAKSHLLTAVLRGQGIPTALCYQRLSHDEGHVLHGLVAVYLDGGWHRQDARGNRADVAAEFSLDGEKLAFPIDPAAGDVDYPGLHRDPAAVVVDTLANAGDVSILDLELPDALP
ncbi:transglutaminase family protein [Nocardia sp. NPDC005978]|uniref:transglutaminase-like domain-containing protein n=1 Tax=unclassified Nocardia TaxID=2637762 RepID=UPI0033B4D81B